MAGDPDWSGGKAFVDRWQVDVSATPKRVFDALCRIGGGHGYHRGEWLWHVRGWLDTLIGGPGLRRGRREPGRVRYGDALDFWRVIEVEPERRLALRAEMRLPGEAQLEFDIEAGPTPGTTVLVQTARFIPTGLFGLAYWYAVLPLHGYVFRGMLCGIRDEAEGRSDGAAPRRQPADRGPWARSDDS